ncbi:MAG: two component, sigma54 specific, transcriptional regulator, Fis family [Deltaproteobacteria bacterium]|jgi:nitrogen-specific signal transduction histidine kinase|nr:two component, sigma54 specific, transcriptional regulator, Fis family [Deltaproteobacteria bacterium]
MNYQELIHSPIIPSQTISLIQKASHNSLPVLIQGEHGTEKELIAKIIHYAGDWKYYRFYKIDCRMQTEDSFNSQLLRVFNENNFGTIPATVYLKEIENLETTIQSKLLDLVEDSFFQMGTEKKIIKNLRFIASSSEDLRDKTAQGRFSEDLYHRLNTLSIHIPPLRDRPNEISAIVQYVLEEYSKRMNAGKLLISNTFLNLLQDYWWPGNLRELQQVIVRSAMFSEGNVLTEKDLLFETGNGDKSFAAFLRKADMRSTVPKPRNFTSDQNTHMLSLLFMELVHRIKNPLVSIKTFTQLLREKFNDGEFREHFYGIVTEDIEKIDAVMNGLIRYVKINTPIEKKDTIHFILEDVLKNHEAQLEGKNIKVFKKFEKDLPETIIHDEQLRYILNALLQYSLPFISPNGSIGFLTKSFDVETETPDGRTYQQGSERYIEILIVFTGYRKPFEQFETVLGIPALQKEEAIELELRLIKDIIQKNQGMMKFEVNEKKPRTVISLKFPIERRRLIYYQPANV